MSDSVQEQTILIIDDSPMIISFLSRILMPKYNLRIAKDGEAGLELARNHDIDLILLDLTMPGISGFDVLAALKGCETTRAIPVIIITGSESSADEELGLTLGAVDYIRKPFLETIVILRVSLHLQLISQMRIIEKFSLTDGLTGIHNRRYFDQQLEAEWSRAIRNGTCLSLLMLDIDRFKLFNDSHGHFGGDLCLKTVARVLKDSVKRKTDFVFRWGGEEFTVLLPDTHAEGVKLIAEQIRSNVAEAPISLAEDKTVYVTVSIGASTVFPKSADNLGDFCKLADDALYEAKENGRNHVVAYNGDKQSV